MLGNTKQALNHCALAVLYVVRWDCDGNAEVPWAGKGTKMLGLQWYRNWRRKQHARALYRRVVALWFFCMLPMTTFGLG